MASKAAGERGSSHPRFERGSNNRFRRPRCNRSVAVQIRSLVYSTVTAPDRAPRSNGIARRRWGEPEIHRLSKVRCSGIGVPPSQRSCATGAQRNTPCAPQPFRTSPDGRRALNFAARRAALRVPRAGRHADLCALRAYPAAALSVLRAVPDADLSVLRAAPDAASCVLNAARYRASSAGYSRGWARGRVVLRAGPQPLTSSTTRESPRG